MKSDLLDLEDMLWRFGRHRLLQALRPGISHLEVEGLIGSVGMKLDVDLEALYGWHDGTSTEGVVLGDIQIFPGFYLLSLEDAVANYQAFVNNERWNDGWLPLFANGGGDFYVVDLHSPDVNAVRHFRIDESEHPIEFSSIKDMFATLVQAFKRGVFFVDPNGYLEMDDLQFGTLAAEMNPHIEWWS